MVLFRFSFYFCFERKSTMQMHCIPYNQNKKRKIFNYCPMSIEDIIIYDNTKLMILYCLHRGVGHSWTCWEALYGHVL